MLNKLLSISLSITKRETRQSPFLMLSNHNCEFQKQQLEEGRAKSGQTRLKKKNHKSNKTSIVLQFSLSTNEICDYHHPGLDTKYSLILYRSHFGISRPGIYNRETMTMHLGTREPERLLKAWKTNLCGKVNETLIIQPDKQWTERRIHNVLQIQRGQQIVEESHLCPAN